MTPDKHTDVFTSPWQQVQSSKEHGSDWSWQHSAMATTLLFVRLDYHQLKAIVKCSDCRRFLSVTAEDASELHVILCKSA